MCVLGEEKEEEEEEDGEQRSARAPAAGRRELSTDALGMTFDDYKGIRWLKKFGPVLQRSALIWTRFPTFCINLDPFCNVLH